jgi:hypothetical protein
MSDDLGRNRSLYPALESKRSNSALPLSRPVIKSWVQNVTRGDSDTPGLIPTVTVEQQSAMGNL